jgi:hypothetical protein
MTRRRCHPRARETPIFCLRHDNHPLATRDASVTIEQYHALM